MKDSLSDSRPITRHSRRIYNKNYTSRIAQILRKLPTQTRVTWYVDETERASRRSACIHSGIGLDGGVRGKSMTECERGVESGFACV